MLKTNNFFSIIPCNFAKTEVKTNMEESFILSHFINGNKTFNFVSLEATFYKRVSTKQAFRSVLLARFFNN